MEQIGKPCETLARCRRPCDHWKAPEEHGKGTLTRNKFSKNFLVPMGSWLRPLLVNNIRAVVSRHDSRHRARNQRGPNISKGLYCSSCASLSFLLLPYTLVRTISDKLGSFTASCANGLLLEVRDNVLYLEFVKSVPPLKLKLKCVCSMY